jgi:hypothetical protein
MAGVREVPTTGRKYCAWALGVVICLGFLRASDIRANDETDLSEQIRQLRDQNGQLQQQLLQQERLIEDLSHRLSDIEGANQKRNQQIGALKQEVEQQPPLSVESTRPFSSGKVILSGEGGAAFFESGGEGQFPNAEFRVDEARLFLDAQVWDDTYFFTELDLITRENPNVDANVEELYIDFENVSRLWNQDRLLNVRVGRFNIPFGEEYQTRYAIDNPLIAHSLSDIWGVDEGVELYGDFSKFDYVVAVQNGGDNLDDFDADKAVVGRLGYNPTKWLRVSASAMRTGNLNVQNDGDTALWFANATIDSVGSPTTTTTFHSELAEGDVQLRLPRAQIKAAGGYLHYDDNDTAANNNRDVYYYYVQGQYDATKKLYGAARFSQIIANGGFPLVGDGAYEYYGDDLTRNLWRLTLGAGYRFSPNLVLKADYSFERGEESDGEKRDHEDLFATELAFRF